MIEHLKVKGEEYPFLFAMKAQREVNKSKDIEDKDNVYFLYLGFKYGCQKEGKTFPYTEDALVDIFEDNFDEFEKAVEVFSEHLGKLKKTQSLILKNL